MPESAGGGELNMMRILMVDDDPNACKIIEIMLSREGYALDFASHGLEALEHVHAHPPDLILMDVLMPVMNGFEATQRLKADPRTALIPIIALTALAFESDRRAAFIAGCNGFIAKPFTRRELLATLHEFLQPETSKQALA